METLVLYYIVTTTAIHHSSSSPSSSSQSSQNDKLFDDDNVDLESSDSTILLVENYVLYYFVINKRKVDSEERSNQNEDKSWKRKRNGSGKNVRQDNKQINRINNNNNGNNHRNNNPNNNHSSVFPLYRNSQEIAERKSKSTKHQNKILLLFDLDGTLIHRSGGNKNSKNKSSYNWSTPNNDKSSLINFRTDRQIYLRPSFQLLFDSILHEPLFEIAFYTSMTLVKAQSIISHIFSPSWSSIIFGIFAREFNEKDKSESAKNFWDTKRSIVKVSNSTKCKEFGFNLTNMILIDNEKRKVVDCVENSLVVHSFGEDPEENGKWEGQEGEDLCLGKLKEWILNDLKEEIERRMENKEQIDIRSVIKMKTFAGDLIRKWGNSPELKQEIREEQKQIQDIIKEKEVSEQKQEEPYLGIKIGAQGEVFVDIPGLGHVLIRTAGTKVPVGIK